MDLEDAIRLITARGRMMQSLPANGAMIAVFTGESQVRTEIASYGEYVSIAAMNGPDNIVISGRKTEIDEITANLKAKGIKTRALDVSHAFHSPFQVTKH
jgi:myxalamid-type polyketide synthase MxaB